MFGWRARIGIIGASLFQATSRWRDQIVPEGVEWVYTNLSVRKLIPEEFEKAFKLLPQVAKEFAESADVDIIICSGSAIWCYIGYERSVEMARQIEKTTGVPTMINATANIEALRAVSARKIVVASPFGKERNEERRKFFQEVGFDVLNIKELGIKRNFDVRNQNPDTSYRLAREAFREAPEAEAIFIDCPLFPVLSIIDTLERDTGKPVVTTLTSEVWTALTRLNIKGPIKGYGRLLEEML